MDGMIKEGLKVHAMIVSVGSTSAPIIKSISQYQPEFVSFLASQDTIDQITVIKQSLASIGIKPKTEVTIADDVNNLLHCHAKAEEAVQRVLDKNYSNDRVIVDYTGGTKNMSVALSLATIIHGFSFSYVGGEKRTKNGVGVVEDGFEEVFQSVNPWDFFALEEKKKITVLFNQNQFKSAKRLVDDILEKNTHFKSDFKKLGFAIEGYSRWDLFRHAEALDSFKRARIDELAESNDPVLRSFAQSTERLQKNILAVLVKKGKKPSYEIVLDLYANAERRCEEGRIDDAILRLYRLVEMIAQCRLMDSFGIDTSNVTPDKIPDDLKNEFNTRYSAPGNTVIKLPQMASFRLLNSLQDSMGKLFMEHIKLFLDIQSSRNNSYLAHGFSSSSEDVYARLRDFVLNLGLFNANDVPRFPKLGC